MKLLKYLHTMNLCEAFQANEMRFAFLNPAGDDFQMVHSWVKCREYFNELLMKNHHPDFKYKTTYGFNYRYDEFPLDLSATRIAISFTTEAQKKTFLDNLDWIHAIENVNNIDPTVVHDVDAKTVVVVASKLWVQKCILTNIYTLLLKLATLDVSKKDVKSLLEVRVNGNVPSEIGYVASLTVPVFNSLLENCTTIAELPCKYVDGAETLRSSDQVHAYSGVMFLQWCMEKKADGNPLQELVRGLNKVFQGKYKTAFIKEAT